MAATKPEVRRTAFELLRAAEAADPRDYAIAAHLAQFLDRMGGEEALPLFERVVAADNSQPGSAIRASEPAGRCATSVAIALRANPALTAARLNLAVAQARMGRRQEAIESRHAALKADPYSTAARNCCPS